MKRKIIKQANQAYTITLPIGWIRAYKLEKELEVDVEEKGNSLIVSTQKIVKMGAANIEITGLHRREAFMKIVAHYCAGYDEIIVTCKEDAASQLRQVINQFISFALFVEKDKYILRDISGSSVAHLDEIYKQTWQLLFNYYRQAIEDVCGSLKDSEETVDSGDREINKFCFYLQRILNKQPQANSAFEKIIFNYSYCLEQISDDINRLWRFCVLNKKNVSALRKMLELSLSCLEDAFFVSYNPDIQRIKAMFTKRGQIRDDALKLKTSAQIRVAHYAISCAERACDMSHLALMKKIARDK